jgi:hypothetical protein
MATHPGWSETQAQQHNVETSYSKLGVRAARDTSAGAMDLNFMTNVSPTKNAKASDEYSRAQILQQKKFVTGGTDEHKNARILFRQLREQNSPESRTKLDTLVANLKAAKAMKV